MPIDRFVSGLAAFAVLGSAPVVLAQSLDVYSYQGLLESGGQPAVGMFDIRFEIYDAAVGGNLLSTTSRTVTLDAADSGLFTLSDLPNDAFATTPASGEWWIQVSVADITLGPGIFEPLGERQFVTSPPTSGGVVLGVTMQAAFDGGNTIDMNGDLLELSDATVGGGAFPILTLGRTSTRGGGVVGYDEQGSEIFSLVPDANGSGASFNLWGGLAGNVFIDGRQGADGSPRVYINGGRSDFAFDTSRTGDSATQLPDGSVNSVELADEAGLSHALISSADLPINNWGSVMSTTIDVPAPGTVLVFGSGSYVTELVSVSAELYVDVGVSVSPTDVVEGTFSRWTFPPDVFGGDGIYRASFALHTAFEVPAAGQYTYYVVGRRGTLSPTAIEEPNLTALYVPTAYGDVATSNQGVGFAQVTKELDSARSPETSSQTGSDEIRRLRALTEELLRRVEAQEQRIDRLTRER